jgi:hypothetical protein
VYGLRVVELVELVDVEEDEGSSDFGTGLGLGLGAEGGSRFRRRLAFEA